MSWSQLREIREENRREAARQAADPPVECPHDGAPLTVKADGTRFCPMGNFVWRA